MSTFIDLGITFTDADDLPQLVDFRTQITSDPSFIGLWKFDDVANLSIVNGTVAEIRNWKAGGPSLVQATVNRQAPIASDVTLGRTVGQFTRATPQSYAMSGAVVDYTKAYTILAVANLDDLTSSNHLAGSFSTGNNRAHVIGATANGVSQIQHGYGDRLMAVQASAGAWTRIVASYDGAMQPKLRVGSTLATGSAATVAPTGLSGFNLGSNGLPLGGKVDLLALFSTDLLAPANAVFLATIDDYLTRRGV